MSKRFFNGDILLLCSDGLSGILSGEEIDKLLNSSEDLLLSAAGNGSDNDNITVLLIQIAS